MSIRSGRAAHPPGTGGMVPPVELLPEVLPTDRLTARARPRPALRDELRRMHPVRNTLNVASVWAQSFGVIAVACWITPGLPLPTAIAAWGATFLLMGRAFAMYAILGHEAAHRLLFRRKRVNDLIGRWLVSYPGFVPFDNYRRSHFAHHKQEFGPDEPDMAFYSGYPIERASFRRKLRRDAFFVSGWKTLRPLLQGLRYPATQGLALRILGSQAGVWIVLVLIGGPGRWWLYPLLWLAPWMTVWRVLNRLRSIAEHGGMTASTDRRMTTHVVRQTLLSRFWMVPFNTGWHLAHHVDMGVPFQQLPDLHRELVASGWVVVDLEHRTYRELWRSMVRDRAEDRSRPPGPGDPRPGVRPPPGSGQNNFRTFDSTPRRSS